MLRERYGEKVRLKPVGQGGGLFRRLGLAASHAGGDTTALAGAADVTLAAVEERLLRQRYGL